MRVRHVRVDPLQGHLVVRVHVAVNLRVSVAVLVVVVLSGPNLLQMCGRQFHLSMLAPMGS